MQFPGNPLRCFTSFTATLIFLLALCPSPARSQNINLVDLPNSSGFLLKNNYVASTRSATAAQAGDFNGDGITDLIIGSPYSPDKSRVYIVFGRSGIADTFDLNSVDNTATSQAFSISDTQFNVGHDVNTAGDFNGDGYDDVILPTRSGADAYVVFGGPDPQPNRDLTTVNASTTWATKFAYTTLRLFKAIGIGDVNSDGYDDIAISTEISISNPDERAWVIFGSPTRHGVMDLANFQTSDENGYSFPNYSLDEISPVGDFNADGYADFVISLGEPSIFRIIILGKASGFSNLSFGPEWPDHSIGIVQDSISNRLFSPIGSVGIDSDFNNDGYSDVLIGGFELPDDQRGYGYVLYGRDDPSTTILLTDVPTSPSLGFRVNGLPGEHLTSAATSAGDVNSDGFADFMLDARKSYNAITNAGSSYVLFGNNNTSGTLNLEADFDPGSTGFRVDGAIENSGYRYFSSPVGDINNDGITDMMFSFTDNNSSTFDTRGYNYVVFGRSPSAGVTNWQLWEPRTTRVRH